MALCCLILDTMHNVFNKGCDMTKDKQTAKPDERPLDLGVMRDDLERCPQCNSWEGLKFPRGLEAYCEDCGWPNEDFGEDYVPE